MGMPLQVTVTLEEETCGKCGGTYAISARYIRQRREEKGGWHCPYCETSWGYWEGENDRLKKELAQEKQRKERALAEANEQRQRAEKSESSHDRLKKRVKNGVCPCCNRTFKQLASHMKHKHPGYKV